MTTETGLPTFQIDNLAVAILGRRATYQELLFAHAIEAAALQSPGIQALRKDAARYEWMRKHWHELAESYTDDTSRVISKIRLYQDDSWPPIDTASLDAAIDAAMEKQP